MPKENRIKYSSQHLLSQYTQETIHAFFAYSRWIIARKKPTDFHFLIMVKSLTLHEIISSMKLSIFSLLYLILFSWLMPITGNASPNNTLHCIEPITHSTFIPKAVHKASQDKKNLGQFLFWVKNKVKRFTKDVKSLKNVLTNEGEKTTKTHRGAIASFIMGFVSIFIAGIPLGILSVIIGMVSLTQIKKNPKYFSGKSLAAVGIIAGFIGFFGALIIVTNM